MSKRFIDLFAGCGGLSLGLSRAGWQGVFAIEKNSDAFATFEHNLINASHVPPFAWPDWLPQTEMTTQSILANHKKDLIKLRGSIDLIAGGPPCQGFSFAGRRNPDDPRNKLTEEYIEIVKLVQPKFILLENVKGFTAAFGGQDNQGKKVYAEIVKEKLEGLFSLKRRNYTVLHKMVSASSFGVPQPRSRFILIAIRNDILNSLSDGDTPFGILEKNIGRFRGGRGLNPAKDTTVRQAISDLTTLNRDLEDCRDSKGFMQIRYRPTALSNYQKLMRRGVAANYEPNSLRLTKHRKPVVERYETVLANYKKGKSLSPSQMIELGTRKQCFTPLHPDQLCKTLTTHPDELLHYDEPRILTVRENARIQSFPDWFEFLGKYTTGGLRRRHDCPRYTQVGNAVPPLMAEALGEALMGYADG